MNIRIIIVICALFCSLQANVYEINTKQQLHTFMEKKQPTVIDFHAPWCGPCKILKPKLEELSEQYSDILFMSIDGDTFRQAQSIYNVRSFPTLIFLDSDNIEVDRVVGFGGNVNHEIVPALNKLRKSNQTARKKPAQKVITSQEEEKPERTRVRRPVQSAPLAATPKKRVIMPIEEMEEEEIVQKPSRPPTVKRMQEPKKKSGIISINTPEEFLRVVKSTVPVVIHFYKSACAVCLDIEDTLRDLSSELQGKVLFVKINADNDNLSGITGRAGILMLPAYSWLFVEKDMNKSFGNHERKQLRRKIMEAITKSDERTTL